MNPNDEEDACSLIGKWESTDAFGNTALDWSQAVKEQKAQLVLEFRADQTYDFKLLASSAQSDDGINITSQFKHIIAAQGRYATKRRQLCIDGDTSGIKWTFQMEEDDHLRIRLEGAKRFGRCKGVDVIYFKRTTAQELAHQDA